MSVETYLIAALVVVAALEGVAIVRLSRALGAVGRFGDRLAHLAAATELLTDTTEVGLANVAVELERTAPQRTARAGRCATARRITRAAIRGQSVEEIAASEALSHGEVRLHLELATPDPTKGDGHGSMLG